MAPAQEWYMNLWSIPYFSLFDINHSKIIFDSPPRVMEIKTKINKWDLIKLKRFCIAKEAINKMKRQPKIQGKIFANAVNDKGLSPKYTCSSVKKSKQKTNNPIKKWAEDLNGHPPKKTHRQPKSTWKDTTITNHQRNAHQNYSGLSPHIHQNGHH